MNEAVDVSETWRRQAVHDLKVAMALARDGYYAWAAYAAQQAAEKAIKAVRYAIAIDTTDEYKHTHQLIHLAAPAPLRVVAGQIVPDDAILGELTQHENDGRYPGVRTKLYRAPVDVYDASLAYRALLMAQGIVEACSALTTRLQTFWRP